jgi:penicillin-binding protein 1A
VSDLFPDQQRPGWRVRIERLLLDLDARFDFSVFQSGKWARDVYERFTTFMDRFHIAGWRRWLIVEPLSEAATLGTGGLMLMLMLAIPSFRETSDENWLKRSELSVTFLDRYGNEIGNRGIKHNDSVTLEDMPDHLIKATLATEDRRFFDHFGIDFFGTFRALLTNARAGGVRQGGSTITQQLAKNLFLSNERTIERKINEAFLALWLETHLAKNEILKLYLDRAYMGGGTFGVNSAAQYYFGKSVRDVTLPEAAMLAGLFKAPSKFSPLVNLPAARARANVVLDNLVEAGFMTEGQVYGARRNPATPIDRKQEDAPNYYLDWAFDEMRKLVDTFPKSVTESFFVVRTAIDPNLQRLAEHEVESALRQYGHDYGASQSALVIADLDGGVRAMVGGRDYGASQFNRAVDALRQPGSSFKPYVYATALASGQFTPQTIVVDSPVCIGNWCPHNYSGGYSGSMTLTQAITNSVNIIPVKLSIALGDGNPKLGRAKINVVEHAVAYATFPNLGKAVAPHAALEVRTGTGELVWRFDRDGKKPEQVISPKVALDMIGMMNSVVQNGTGRRAQLDGIQVAGKTGTTNGYRDAWFVGYTGNFSGATTIRRPSAGPAARARR